MDEDYWALGVALEEAYRNDAYRNWGYDSWKEYVEDEVDVGLRKAQYLVKLQGWFEQMSPAIQQWMRGLGWTKARMLMHVVTQENAAEWKARVAGKTVAQIEEMIDADKKAASSDGGGREPSDDEKEETFVKVSLSLSQSQKDLYDIAMAKAGDIAESDKPGHLLTSIIQGWLAINTDVLTKEDLLKDTERYIGWKIIAVKYNEETQEHEIMWGHETVDLMNEEGGEIEEDQDVREDENVKGNVGDSEGEDDSEEDESEVGL
jgi:hypothetical protein